MQKPICDVRYVGTGYRTERRYGIHWRSPTLNVNNFPCFPDRQTKTCPEHFQIIYAISQKFNSQRVSTLAHSLSCLFWSENERKHPSIYKKRILIYFGFKTARIWIRIGKSSVRIRNCNPYCMYLFGGISHFFVCFLYFFLQYTVGCRYHSFIRPFRWEYIIVSSLLSAQ